MRLIVTILWCLAALFWLPWALLVLRLIVDLALGTPWSQSTYVTPAFVGIWPVYGLLRPWPVVSWWPLGALAGVMLSAAGWRLYWLDLEGILTRPPYVIWASILLPVIAPFLMYGDARRRHHEREMEFDESVQDAQERMDRQDDSHGLRD